MLQWAGRMLITFGIITTVIGVALYFGGKIGIRGLPGDIIYKKGNFTFYFPIITCIAISIILTVLFNILRFIRFKR